MAAANGCAYSPSKLGTLLAGVGALAVAASLLYLGTFWVVAEVAGYPGDQTARSGANWP